MPALPAQPFSRGALKTRHPCFGRGDNFEHKLEVIDLPLRRQTNFTESLILAQDERWRRASYMQVEREARSLLRVESGERVSNT